MNDEDNCNGHDKRVERDCTIEVKQPEVARPAWPVSAAQVRNARLDATANAILPMLAHEDASKGPVCDDAYAWAYALEAARERAIGSR